MSQLLGTIALTQIHRDRMVNSGRYHDDLLTPVEELWLGEDGVVGVSGDNVYLHGHHRLHPNKRRAENAKDFRPNRLLSIGFTGHYALVADRFGEVPLGIAAEDVIVEHDGRVELDQLTGGVEIRTADGVIELADAAVAKPCVPYTKFLLGDQDAADEVVAPNRAFLEEGMRGFVFGLEGKTEPVRIAVGDEVWAV